MRPSNLFPLFADVTALKGVGPGVRKALKRLVGISDALPGLRGGPEAKGPMVRDLLFHLPSGLVDRRYTSPLMTAPEGVTATFVVTVDEHIPPGGGKYGARGRPYKITCSDESGGTITLVFFNPRGDYLEKMLPVGAKRVISGKTEKFDYHLQMTHPDIIAPVEELEDIKRVEPVYPLTQGISNRQLTKLMQQVEKRIPDLPEWIERRYLSQQYWRNWKQAMVSIHHPQSEKELLAEDLSRQRLAFDELLANQLALGLVRERTKKKPGYPIRGSNVMRHKTLKELPFALTSGQDRVLAEIDEDMASGNRMIRLLQGDVGSGKTVVALLAMLRVVENGKQAGLMVPTEILGRQHFAFIESIASKVGVRVALLTGSIKGKQRAELLGAIEMGLVDIVIGTHALFQEKIVFKDLALIVVDEQHRFGVAQRLALTAKGKSPHLLLMTATPIPRSLTMTFYGDMDSSLLTEKPSGRPKIDTRAIPLSRAEEVIAGLKRVIGSGNKVYWICPLIEENTEENNFALDLAAAEARHREFSQRFGDVVGLMHGRMKGDDREKVMSGFVGNQYDILVATTVVEVGVDVPDATIIVIEHAERFGLAQLHQLRGRVGRSDKPSTCILLYTDKCGDIAKERLRVIRETDDGFRIAEEDLRLRGSGEILGTKQSGMPEFHFANILQQGELLRAARDDVKMILQNDAELKTPRGEALRTLLYLFEYDETIRFLHSG